MLNPKQMNSFKKDVKVVQKRGKNTELLKALISDLVNEIPLAPKYEDHPLHGKYNSDRSCHIEPDWLLVYTIIGSDLILVRTGTHSDLYK